MCREVLMVDLCHPHLSQYTGKRLLSELARCGRLNSNRQRFFLMDTKRVKCHYAETVHDAEVLETLTIETVDDVERVWEELVEGA